MLQKFSFLTVDISFSLVRFTKEPS